MLDIFSYKADPTMHTADEWRIINTAQSLPLPEKSKSLSRTNPMQFRELQYRIARSQGILFTFNPEVRICDFKACMDALMNGNNSNAETALIELSKNLARPTDLQYYPTKGVIELNQNYLLALAFVAMEVRNNQTPPPPPVFNANQSGSEPKQHRDSSILAAVSLFTGRNLTALHNCAADPNDYANKIVTPLITYDFWNSINPEQKIHDLQSCVLKIVSNIENKLLKPEDIYHMIDETAKHLARDYDTSYFLKPWISGMVFHTLQNRRFEDIEFGGNHLLAMENRLLMRLI